MAKNKIKTAKEVAEERRSHVRTRPQNYDYLYMAKEQGGKEIMAMIIDESDGGCSAVIRTVHLTAEEVTAGSTWYLRLGRQNTRKSEVRWVNQLNEQLLNCGFMFLE